MIKFPTPWGIAILVSQTATMFECRKVGKEKAREPVEKVKPQEEVGPTEEVLVNLAHPDQLVTTGAYKGYHQVKMAEEDEEKVAFYTDQGTYCYTKMSFSLKNARATWWMKHFSLKLELKKMILKLPSLTTPLPKEVLYIYLAVSKEAIIVVQLANRKGKKCPVHYVSRTLHDVERNYASLEKLALTLL
ncbi:reverse transcriptase domain-containing protein, partial [Tanacetum coccineum]